MEYLMPAAFLGVAFFLGAFITNFFKSQKIDVLTQEAQGAQSRFYELQNLSKKQLGEKNELIRRLQKDNSAKVTGSLPPNESPTESAKRIQSLEDKNKSLKQELMSLKAKNKELKVEKAIKQVDKKYPMQLYGMDGEQPFDVNKKSVQAKKEKTKKTKLKKLQAKIVASDESPIQKKKKQPKANKKAATIKSIKSKKKSKSKKGKSKKVLALVESGKKRKKKKSSKKKKKK